MTHAPPSAARRALAEQLAPQMAGAPAVRPFAGRTYTLRRGADSPAAFYAALDAAAGDFLARRGDLREALEEVRAASRDRRRLGRAPAPASSALALAAARLDPWLEDVEAHRAALSFGGRRDFALGATREQLLLYMLEIELTNRLHGAAFARAPRRIALLPHCLRDLTRACKSRREDVDHACAGCSPRCEVQATSRLLRERGVEPYLWLTADLDRLLAAPGAIGVLGIACVPELVSGMRHCDRSGAPVLGVPLDANRCRRWFGEFHDNTVSRERLAALLASGGPCAG